MVEESEEYSIIFEKVNKMCMNEELLPSSDELIEYKEIEKLRKIVLDISEPEYTYQTSA